MPYPCHTLPVPGWTVVEMGRQPWLVYGLMKTADGVSPVAASQVAVSLVAFTLVYLVLGIVAFLLWQNMHVWSSVSTGIYHQERR